MPISNKALPMSRCHEKTEARNPQESLKAVGRVPGRVSFLDGFIVCSSLKSKSKFVWIKIRQVEKEGKDLGSWDRDGGFIGQSCGRVGTTATCLLTLEVYYRHLPLYKRGQNGAAVRIIEGR